MKILAIGGSGGMGRFAVNAVQHFEKVEKIIVADLHLESARGFADEMNDKVSAIALDVNDTLALQAALSGVDIVMNTCDMNRRAQQWCIAGIQRKPHRLACLIPGYSTECIQNMLFDGDRYPLGFKSDL